MRKQSLFGVVVVALLVALALPAGAKKKGDTGPELPPTRQDITCVGFSANGKEAVFRIIDENVGTMFQVRSVKKNEILKSFPFSEDEEKRAWHRVKKAHNVHAEFADAPENPKKNVVMMSQVKGDKILIHMMRGEAIKPYLDIPLYKSKKGQVAEAFVKQMVWDHKGKYAVVVYHQKTAGRMKWEGDFVKAFKFKLYKTGFGSGAP